MSYDIYLVKKKHKPANMSAEDWDVEQWEEVPNVCAIRGLGYGADFLPFTKGKAYMNADGSVLTLAETKKLGREMAKDFNEYAEKHLADKVEIYKGRIWWSLGSCEEGIYYKNMTKATKDQFINTLRWLNVYMAAIALGYRIRLG